MRTTPHAKFIIATIISLCCMQVGFGQSDLNITLEFQPFRPLATQASQLSFNNIEPTPFAKHSQPDENSMLRLSHSRILKESIGNQISIQRELSTMIFIGLGGYENYTSNIDLNTNNHTSITVGLGLTKQYSYLNAHRPNIHLALSAQYAYRVNSWLYIYTHGQYLTPPINQPNQVDPFTYMSPLFNKTEVQYSIKAIYKNIETNIGVKTLYDTQFEKSKPINLMHSKIKIGL